MTIVAFGKYEVIEKIGEGGFGKVYKGRHPYMNRIVAIKTCPSGDPKLRQRFLREAEIAGSLQHPNIITVYAFDIEGDTPYLVQEYLSGEDLDHKIKRRQVLAESTKLGYLVQLAEGLRYAHTQNVVHRDVKPANVRILDNGQVRIMDFGIAKLLTAELQLTQTGMTLGTAGYLPPEQLRGESVDLRADQFSFGVLAYELMTYERPFAGPNLSAILYAIAHKDPPPITERWPECPPPLAAMIETCLRKDPARRYESFSEILAVLRPLSNLSRPAAVPPPPAAKKTEVDPVARTVVVPAIRGDMGKAVGLGAGERVSKAFPIRIAAALLVGVGILGLWWFLSQVPRPVEKTPGTTTETTTETTTSTGTSDILPPDSVTLPPDSVTGDRESTTGEPESTTGEPDLATDPDRALPSPGPPPKEPEPGPRTSPPPATPRPTSPPRGTDPESEPGKPESIPPPEAPPPEAPPPEAPPPEAPPPDQLIMGVAPDQVGRLDQGQQVYSDRDFRFAAVPDAYRNLRYIRTLNGDKKKAASVSFTVNQAVEVFVAHDQRLRKKPDWLRSFRSTGQQLAVNEGGRELRVAFYDVYVQDFPAGRITLGPNTRPKAKAKSMSMYLVFLRPR